MLILLALLAQAPAAPLPQTNVRVSLDRVAQEAGRPALDLNYPLPDRPIFRVRVRERALLEPLWKEKSGTPAYVRPARPPVHHEFLSMVTPDEFRSAVLYPCCITVAPMFEYLQDEVRKAIRSHRESRAKRTVYNAMRKAGLVTKKD